MNLDDIFGTAPVKPAIKPDCIKYHYDVEQGSDEWLAMRRGILTASEMKLVITPTLKAANNDKEKAHLYELVAQRITGYVEPFYISDDMLRGQEDEIEARALYSEKYAPVEEVGFITNDSLDFVIGYSPDGVVGDDGLIEVKSRRQKYQVKTLIEWADKGIIPDEYMIQIQTGLWVTGRKWCDFISYSGGLEMVTIRVFPDATMQEALIAAATTFEMKIRDTIEKYRLIQSSPGRLIPTVRRVEQEITL